MPDITAEQLKEAARKAYEAGDIATSKALGERAQAMEAANAPRRDFGTWVQENFFDDNDPTSMNWGEKAAALLNQGGEGMTRGVVGDEAAAAADALIGRGDYSDRLQHYRGMETQIREEHPWLTLGSEVGGAILPSLLTGDITTPAETLPGRMAVGALSGGTQSGIYGFMEGEGGFKSRLASARGFLPYGIGIGGGMPLVQDLGSRAVSALRQRSATKALTKTVSTLDDLIKDAGDLYDEAGRLGVTASPTQTKGLAGNIETLLQGEGLIGPTGRVSRAYPKVTGALDLIRDYADQTMTTANMKAVRKLLRKAAGSSDDAERRVGVLMLKMFDDFVDPLAPQIRQANAIWTAVKRSQDIEKIMRLADLRAGQFTQSGMDNALRTEFRALARDIIKNGARGMTPDQVAAINAVAKGGPVQQGLSAIGRMAPRGPVSTGAAAGVPFFIGNAIGGPPTGLAAAGGTMAIAEAARQGSTAMRQTSADIVDALMRSPSGTVPKVSPQLTQNMRNIIDALFKGSVPVLSKHISQSFAPQFGPQ